MVLHQHEAAQVRAEVPLGSLGQRSDHGLAVRCNPTLSPVADRLHRQHKLLDQICLEPLKRDPAGAATFNTRSSTSTRGWTLPRRRRLSWLPGLAGSVAFSIPLGLISGRPFRPFSRATSSRSSTFVRLSAATSSNSRTTSSFNWVVVSSSRPGGGLTHRSSRLRTLQIQKIRSAADHAGRVTFPNSPETSKRDGRRMARNPRTRWVRRRASNHSPSAHPCPGFRPITHPPAIPGMR